MLRIFCLKAPPRVLRHLLIQGIVCIPIQDSFIAQAQYADQAESAMKESVNLVFPHLKPKLKWALLFGEMVDKQSYEATKSKIAACDYSRSCA